MAFFTALAVGAFSTFWFGVVCGAPPEIAIILALMMTVATLVAFAVGA